MVGNKRQRGLGLIELLLVLGIAAALTLIGINRQRAYQLDKAIDALELNVSTLLWAGSQYYHQFCIGEDYALNGKFTFNLADVQKAPSPNGPINFLPNGLLQTTLTPDGLNDYSLGSVFLQNIKNANLPIELSQYQIHVTATITVASNDDATAQWYKDRLSAFSYTLPSANKITLVWRKLTSFIESSTNESATSTWIGATGANYLNLLIGYGPSVSPSDYRCLY